MGPTAGQWLTQTRGGRAMLVGGVLAGATYLMTRGARADTPGGSTYAERRGTPSRETMLGLGMAGGIATMVGGALIQGRGILTPGSRGRILRGVGRALRYGGLAMAGANMVLAFSNASRAETRPNAGGSGGSIDISGTAVVAGGAAVAGYAGYRMLTRGAPAPAPAAVPAAAAPGRLARGMGLLRRAALPLTALAVLNEASRGFTAGGASGALRGAGNALTFGGLDMVAGALPARPSTAGSDAHAAALSGAQVAGVNASAAIASLGNGSSVGAPGVAVSSDGMTAGYQRNRRLASGITISETVSAYQTPVRR